ncbi:unnamed protein product, partial [marine sediment metagenome]
ASKEMIYNQVKQLSPAQQIKFKNYMKTIKQIQKTGVPPVKKVTLEGMDKIPIKARNQILNYLRANKDLLGGSTAQRTQTYGGQRSYAQSDIDIYTKSNPYNRAKDLANILRNSGIKRVSNLRGEVHISGKKIIDFHDMNMYAQNIYEAEGWYKPVRTTITEDPSGIRVMKITSQWKRKLISSYLQGRYAKDYPDFKLITKSMYETARLKGVIKEPEIKILDFKPPKEIITPTKGGILTTTTTTTTYPSLYKTPLRVAPYFYGVPKKVSPFVYPYRLPKKTPYVPPYVSPKR